MSTVSDKDGSDKDGPDKDLPDEQQLEEYLRGGSDVSRQYRQLRSADVPAELDRVVLRQAQEAVKARPVQARPAKSRTWMRWAGPLALAASAVLVLSIVIESGVHEDAYLAVPASAPAEVTARQEAAEQPAAGIAAEKSAIAADEAEDKAAARDASVVHILPVEPGTAPEMHMEVPPPAMVVDEPAPFSNRAIRPAAPPPASANPQFAGPPSDQRAGEPPAELARRDQTHAIAQSSARAAAPAPAQTSVAPEVSLLDEDDSVQDVIVTGMKRPKQTQTAGPRNTIAAPATADSASNAAEQEDEPRNYSDPEQWLRDIRELRKGNKHEEADREWRRFRYVFPNYGVADSDPARGALR